MKNLTDQQVEQLLASMPHNFEFSAKADAAFYTKLHALAVKKFAHSNPAPEAGWSFFTMHRLAFAGSFAALVLVVGGTAWAYQSSVTRGNFLYPLKQTGEQVELAFASSSSSKIDAHLRFSDRRLEEAENIVNHATSTAWLIEKAYAETSTDINLEPAAANNLALTLADMRKEVALASEIVEKKVSTPVEVQHALAQIAKTSDRHVTALTALEKKTGPSIKPIIEKIVLEEDDHLAAVFEAKEEAEDAVLKKELKINVVFTEPVKTTPVTATAETARTTTGKREEHEAVAAMQLQKTVGLFEQLPAEKKLDLQIKMDKAKEALDTEKFGEATGLSRALEKKIENQPEFKMYIKNPSTAPAKALEQAQKKELEKIPEKVSGKEPEKIMEKNPEKEIPKEQEKPNEPKSIVPGPGFMPKKPAASSADAKSIDVRYLMPSVLELR